MTEPRAADGPRWLPWLLVPLALLPNPAAALPLRSYFFRDFSITLLPYRLFAAREWASLRWPVWNPYLHEGTFAVPALYPLDLLHVLWPDPRWVSWLLTLHLPLAAFAAYRLARDIGAARLGAFLVGAVYCLGGYAVSCLNLYVFLQALAWVPLVAVTLRRAALRGGRSIAVAAVVTGVGFTTLAFEFLSQGVLLGLGLAFLERRDRGAFGRVAASLALAAGLAALPVVLTLGLLPETARGQGFLPQDALEGELPPVAWLQTFILGLFGSPAAPFEGWWGPFFRKGSPYFLSVYLGPLALALAAAGVSVLEHRRRRLLLAGLLLGGWIATGATGGLAPHLLSLPGLSWFRTPAKALLFGHLALSVLAGLGLERLGRGSGWDTFRIVSSGLSLGAAAVAVVLAGSPATIGAWFGVAPQIAASVAPSVVDEALQSAALAAAGLVLAGSVSRGLLRTRPATALVGAAVVVDLVRAAAGVNPQVPVAFYELEPALAASVRPSGEPVRIFSYGLQASPAFRERLAQASHRPSAWIFSINRQLLVPYTNMLDGIESGETPDLTGFGPAFPELRAEDYAPTAVGRILPRLRAAGVHRVVSLDPLADDDLELKATVPIPAARLAARVYQLRDALPIAALQCRGLAAPGAEAAFRSSLEPGFDPTREAAVEGPALEPAGGACRAGTVVPGLLEPARESYATDSEAETYLLVRRGFARGWSARLDGAPAPLYRANGRHRAVRVPPGRHQIVLRYRPPGRALGLALLLGSGILTLALWLRSPAD